MGIASAGHEQQGQSRDNWEEQSRFHEQDPYKGETRWRLCDAPTQLLLLSSAFPSRLNVPDCCPVAPPVPPGTLVRDMPPKTIRKQAEASPTLVRFRIIPTSVTNGSNGASGRRKERPA
jgi:hypothetical protein